MVTVWILLININYIDCISKVMTEINSNHTDHTNPKGLSLDLLAA